MKRSKMRKSIALLLSLVMLFTCMQMGVFGATDGTTCNHVHDASCGYREAQEEIPCDMDCSETDEDGNLIHAEGCSFRAAVEASECTHEHDAFCGGLKGQDEDAAEFERCGLTEGCTLADGHDGECDVKTGETIDDENDSTVIISEFLELKEKQQTKVFAVGTEDVELPSKLKALDADGEEICVKVTWECAKGFDPECEGEYIFTPVVGSGYEVMDGVVLPSIKVILAENVNDIALLDIEDEEETPGGTGEPITKARIEHKDKGEIQVTIESYMVDETVSTKTVKPCDFIFLLEQSKWMNTREGTDAYGKQRENILGAIDHMLKNIVPPTGEGEEHRVALVGYGRINNHGPGDSYNKAQYPGKKINLSKDESLNTGYYTYKDGSADFHYKGSWTEPDFANITDELPTVPENYMSGVTYDDVFMSIENAQKVVNREELEEHPEKDNIMAWYAGASRMDAGFAVTNELVDIANAHKGDKERNLIICMACSSLPNRNQSDENVKPYLRAGAAIKAGNDLKEKKGATIFAIGDYHNSGMVSLKEVDTQKFFNDTMRAVSGYKDMPEDEKYIYFKGMSESGSFEDAMMNLLTRVEETVAGERLVPCKVEPVDFTVVGGNEESTVNWGKIKSDHNILKGDAINETANVAYYAFTGYEDGVPQFNMKEPVGIEEIPIKDLENESGNGISWNTKLMPIIPDNVTRVTPYGYKVVITLTDPVEVTYEWAEEYQGLKAKVPDDEYISRGAKHSAKDPHGEHKGYLFHGWYTDKACTNKYEQTEGVKEDIHLYGKWVPAYIVTYDLNGGTAADGVDYSMDPVVSGTVVTVKAEPERVGYEFKGWKVEGGTDIYEPGKPLAVLGNVTLIAQWTKIGGSGGGGTTYYHVSYKGNGHTDGTEPKDNKNYRNGDTVTVKEAGTLEKDGYVFVGWNTEKDGSGTNYDPEDTFKIKKDTTLYAQWKKDAAEKPNHGGNTDVPVTDDVPALNKEDHFAYMAGYPDGTFLQERNMTRAEVTVMFSRLITEKMTEDHAYPNSFNDVTADKWYYNQIGYMEQFGIIKGYPDGSFRPDAPITRAEFATIAAKFDELKETGNTNFTDLTDAHWAKKFIEMAHHRGWISGYPDGTVKPDRCISRAEVVSVTNRMLERAGDKAYIDSHKELIKNYIDITNSHWAYYDVMEASNGHLYEKDNTEVWTEVQKR